MNRARDPAWLRAATRVFDACLWLYPTRFRHAHGEEMRQAFRDRCREAADGRRSAARMLLLELLPDTIRSATSAHWSSDMGEAHRRNLLALALVALVLGTLIFREQLQRPWLGEAIYATSNANQARTLARQEGQVRALASVLETEGSPASSAQAAYLYRGLYDGRLEQFAAGEHAGESPREHYRAFLGLLPADGDRAVRAVQAVLGDASSSPGWVAAAAAHACIAERGCNRAPAIDRLVELEPDNAYGWSLAYSQASIAGNPTAMRAALAKMASATYYDDHLGAIRAAIFGSASRLLPDDADARAAVAMRIADSFDFDTQHFPHDARFDCARLGAGNSAPPRMELHPEIETDCLRVARLMARSESPVNALRGWRMIGKLDDAPEAAASGESAMRLVRAGVNGVGIHRNANGRGWTAWSTEEWNAWAGLWTPGATEATVARLRMKQSDH